ncbi:MAG: M48 family metallopeptidase [Planktotalea sp.]|jgi:predicted Zn-dependent protease|uniref:M48 family metallopeptidase n=1 Tax=Planktotalea sp. TaxID=2029877 RepID=UPI000183BF31|nr:M48 family metallopeptidase [Planktotalea sp.]EDZ42669.1 peptidase, M48 family [Rhodobacteraceae bacterium HTCC2083]MDG1076073.1 M48 family metallopeptidase [Planktotalea sp.]MDG1086044.1 M48 family metallopeptidase [Planktotalea sp.]
MIRYLSIPLLAVSLSACVSTPSPEPAAPSQSSVSAPTSANAEQAARQFVKVVQTVEPVAEAECRARTTDLNCDFNIVVDDRPGQAPNAFQTLDKNGRPVLAFNIPLIATVRNADELAFVMGHEAAHHIQEHLARQQVNATAGALIFGGLAAITGGGEQIVQTAQQVGATVGARGYSKDFELEADRLGTVISHKAGYDPVRGAAFFTRIPDPGNTFLGTHPPNALRINTVRKTAAKL